MAWLLLPLTVGAVIWWWPAGESVPALQSAPVLAPAEAVKDLPSLPAPPLKSDDWPEIEKAVRQAMAQCAPSFSPWAPLQLETLGQQPPPPLVGQVECLLGWFKVQGGVKALRAPLAEAEGKAALRLLTSLPAQVEIEVDFLVEDQGVQTRVLTLVVDAGEQFEFASLRPGPRAGP
ncbi:MAG: hypothetical protein HYW07_09325 [Candidatus Latescibacteria bacterium]|nr:hypothetical protein [Candidatus Latescibacterota bacterium]